MMRYQESMILSSCKNKNLYLHLSLKEFLKLFKCLSCNITHTINGRLDLLFNALHLERKRIKERFFYQVCMDTLSCGRSPQFIDIEYENFVQIPHSMSISTNVHISRL